MSNFQKELIHLINCACIENESDTPDFILAGFIRGCLDAFNWSVKQRELWYGRKISESHIESPNFAEAKPVSGGLLCGEHNNESFQLLCERFVKWCNKEGSFKVDAEMLQLIIDMRSATKNVS